MKLKDYIYFGENGEITYTHSTPLYFNKYHYDNYRDDNTSTKILSANSSQVRISTLWQMQVLGEAHGINIIEHESGYSEYELESGKYTPDTLDKYFEELAYLAAWYGCETMELKCLIKALFWKYELAKSAELLPLTELQSLYVRLSESDYRKCAKWLLQYHCKRLGEIFEKPNYDRVDVDNSKYARNVVDYRINYNVINDDLAEHLNKQILPRYASHAKGHQEEHIQQVAKRCKAMVEEHDLNDIINIDLLLTAAYFYDLGFSEGQNATSCQTAVKILREDGFIRDYFASEQIDIIAEAIEDHCASTKTTPRSLYGELLNAADKIIDHKDIIRRTYNNRIIDNPCFTQEEHLESLYHYFLEKYGKRSYTELPKFAPKEDEYNLFELEYQLGNKSRFVEYCTQYLALK